MLDGAGLALESRHHGTPTSTSESFTDDDQDDEDDQRVRFPELRRKESTPLERHGVVGDVSADMSPGPAHYRLPHKKIRGGRFSESVIPGQFELLQRAAAAGPGKRSLEKPT